MPRIRLGAGGRPSIVVGSQANLMPASSSPGPSSAGSGGFGHARPFYPFPMPGPFRHPMMGMGMGMGMRPAFHPGYGMPFHPGFGGGFGFGGMGAASMMRPIRVPYPMPMPIIPVMRRRSMRSFRSDFGGLSAASGLYGSSFSSPFSSGFSMDDDKFSLGDDDSDFSSSKGSGSNSDMEAIQEYKESQGEAAEKSETPDNEEYVMQTPKEESGTDKDYVTLIKKQISVKKHSAEKMKYQPSDDSDDSGATGQPYTGKAQTFHSISGSSPAYYGYNDEKTESPKYESPKTEAYKYETPEPKCPSCDKYDDEDYESKPRKSKKTYDDDEDDEYKYKNSDSRRKPKTMSTYEEEKEYEEGVGYKMSPRKKSTKLNCNCQVQEEKEKEKEKVYESKKEEEYEKPEPEEIEEKEEEEEKPKKTKNRPRRSKRATDDDDQIKRSIKITLPFKLPVKPRLSLDEKNQVVGSITKAISEALQRNREIYRNIGISRQARKVDEIVKVVETPPHKLTRKVIHHHPSPSPAKSDPSLIKDPLVSLLLQ